MDIKKPKIILDIKIKSMNSLKIGLLIKREFLLNPT